MQWLELPAQCRVLTPGQLEKGANISSAVPPSEDMWWRQMPAQSGNPSAQRPSSVICTSADPSGVDTTKHP